MNKFARILYNTNLLYKLRTCMVPKNFVFLQCHNVHSLHKKILVTHNLQTSKRLIKSEAKTVLAISLLTWLGFVEDDKDKESELIMTLKRAVLCMQRDQHEKAEQMLHLALRIAQQQQHEQGVLYCFDLMANLAFEQHELDKAHKLFVHVLQMLLAKGTAQDDIKV